MGKSKNRNKCTKNGFIYWKMRTKMNKMLKTNFEIDIPVYHIYNKM